MIMTAIGLLSAMSSNIATAQDPIATNDDWRPTRLSLELLRHNDPSSNPLAGNRAPCAESGPVSAT